ncbi:MAG TPA: DUF3048 domain-containing protein [Candidatus Saccharimonadales bacterium]|nr:DUF3048 domain-containing protein [Candidatus Saccharimonadales bacterium]
MKKLIRKFKRLSRKKKIIVIIAAAAILAGIAALILNLGKEEPAQPEPPQKFYSQLTGNEVSEEISNRPVLAVMIENSEAARPQTGLDSAGIVFEAVTEGGITRFLALYQEDMPKEIGPVRSVRPHFVSWLYGFDASVAHVGGSFNALQLVEQLKAKTLTQFTYTEPYRRSSERAAPHNVYASTKALRSLQAELEYGKSEFSDIPRSDDSPAEMPDAKKISLDFSSPAFAVEFRYNKESNAYTRYLAGAPHVDASTNKPITVKNVVVIKVKGTNSDTIKAVGKGEAWVFKNGTSQKVRWEKSSHEGRIKIVDEMGNEVPLNRGDTWIAALTENRKPQF